MSNTAPLDLDALEARWKAEGKNYWAGGKLEAFDCIEEAVEVIPQLIARVRELEADVDKLKRITDDDEDTIRAKEAILAEAERALEYVSERIASDSKVTWTIGDMRQCVFDALQRIRAAKGGTE